MAVVHALSVVLVVAVCSGLPVLLAVGLWKSPPGAFQRLVGRRK